MKFAYYASLSYELVPLHFLCLDLHARVIQDLDSNHEFSLLLILIIKVIHSKTFPWVDFLSFLGFLDQILRVSYQGYKNLNNQMTPCIMNAA